MFVELISASVPLTRRARYAARVDLPTRGRYKWSAGLVLSLAVILPTLAGSAFADSADSLLVRSRAAEQAGQHDVAIRLAQAAIVADPARTASYTALGDLYAAAKEEKFARFYYAKALSIDPQDPAALRGIARADAAEKPPTTAAASSLDNKDTPH